MSDTNKEKDLFMKSFEVGIIQGRKLLKSGNHRWADKVFTNLHFNIQKATWLNTPKRNQLYSLINNSWEKYIGSIVQIADQGKSIDIIKYIDAYNRFFNILVQQDNYFEVMRYGNTLIESFIHQSNISMKGLVKFINSLSIIMKDTDNNQDLLQTQILLIFLKKSIAPSDLYYYTMEYLNKSLKKVDPNKRGLLLYVILENINNKFGLTQDSSEFLKEINKIMINRLTPELKEDFSRLSKISINETNFDSILEELETLLMYLNDIGEVEWVLSIIENVFNKFIQFKSFTEAVEYIRGYTYFLIQRNRFEIAFKIYDILERFFGTAFELEYNFPLIELWAEACKWLIELEDKKYFLKAIEKFQKSIINPATPKQIIHYFYAYNLIWKLKSSMFSLERFEFWNMLFYRALFEEGDLNLSLLIVNFLPKKIRPFLSNLPDLQAQCEVERGNIFLFDQQEEALPSIFNEVPNLKIKELVIKIQKIGKISIYGRSEDNFEFHDSINDENWNDLHILKLYNDVMWNPGDVENLGLMELGRLLFFFLPKKLRTILIKIRDDSVDYVPNIYLILDEMTAPFELIHDGLNLISFKYSIGYTIGETSLEDITSQALQKDSTNLQARKYSALIIGALNLMLPSKWDEDAKRSILMYPFEEGLNELNYILNYFNESPNTDQLMYCIKEGLTRDMFLNHIVSGTYDIIHIVGNLFYSELNPKNSYFLTNDYQIVSISDINNALEMNVAPHKPLLFLNVRCFNLSGNLIQSNLQVLPKIIKSIEKNSVAGIISRTYPIFTDESKEMIINFYNDLTSGLSLGHSFLLARQKSLLSKNSSGGVQSSPTNISLESLFAVNSFILFGKPWRILE